MKYRLSQIAAVVGGRFSGTDCEVQSVVTDSRSLTCELGSGPVFVAMCGANHDSHAFVAQMYARGVRAFMVERPLEALPECGYVVVENAIAALQCLAAYHRAQFRGTVVGITVGALPGFTPTMGIAVLIPITYSMDPTTALVFLGAIYCGSMFGGSISAILINTPGTSAAAATAMDGYAMTAKGKSHAALVEASVASFWGGIVSVLALIFLAPPLAKFAFQFGPQEKFMMALFGLTIIASLSTKDVLKGLKSAGGFLRRELGRALQLRYTPELQFIADDSIQHGAHILEILRQVERQDEARDDPDAGETEE